MRLPLAGLALALAAAAAAAPPAPRAGERLPDTLECSCGRTYELADGRLRPRTV